MRDVLFACLMLCALPLAIARPFNAYLLWGWSGLLVPTAYFYGFMTGARVNLSFAVLTLSLILLGRVKWKGYQSNPMSWLYLIFIFHATLVFAFGYVNNPLNAQYYELLIKGLAFSLAMPFFVRERIHFHALLIVIALGLGIHGVLNGLKSLASGGGHNMYGPAGTMLADRNHLTAALTLVLPIIFYLYTYSAHRFARASLLCAFGVMLVAIVAGGSRAGFVAVLIFGVWLVVASKRKKLASVLFGVAAAAFFLFSPEDITNRLSTIKEAGDDSSFIGRVIAWKISSAIAVANPFFGGGFHAVQVQYIWDAFKTSPGLLGFLSLPVPEFAAKAAHSIYFEIIGDMGFVGFAIFMAILFRSIYVRFAIKRIALALGQGHAWATDMADMLALSVIVYMVAGSSVSLGYFEVIYIIAMLLELIKCYLNRRRRALKYEQVAVD